MADKSTKAKKGLKKKSSILPVEGSPKRKLQASDIINGLNEKDVEIDHLKTTIVSLNTKVVTIEDIRTDRDNGRVHFKESEERREELHIHMKETVVKIEEDTQEHVTY